MANRLKKTGAMIVVSLAAISACNKSSEVGARSPVSELPPNNSYVLMTGVVTEAGPDAFRLDYGGSNIVVEMDDFDPQEEGRTIEVGDEVTVHGYIDNEFYEQRSIEAGRVDVLKLNTSFFASSLDEEDFPDAVSSGRDSTIDLTGYVLDVQGRKLTLRTENQTVTVDTKSMERNPLDDIGHQKIVPGDEVHVIGWLTHDFFNRFEIAAENVVTIEPSDS